MKSIDIALVFNDNYSIPCAVTIESLMDYRNKNYIYKFHVISTDITECHKFKLKELVDKFANCEIFFIEGAGLLNEYYDKVSEKNYPKEMYFKLILTSLFPNIEKIVVTDVDVVFNGDITKEFESFTTDEYFAGVKMVQEKTHPPFSLDIKDNGLHFLCGAGYLILNLNKMRKDDIEKELLRNLIEFQDFLKLPDQELLTITCYPKIKLIHPRNMVLVSWLTGKEFGYEFLYEYKHTCSEKEFKEALENPIQIHYVEGGDRWKKPWIDPACPVADKWYMYLSKTNFFMEHIRNIMRSSTDRNKKHKESWFKRSIKIFS